MKFKLSLLLIIIPLIGISQSSLLSSLIETSQPLISNTHIKAELFNFISNQQVKRLKINQCDEVKFLRTMVNSAHRKFLKNYKAYSQFNEAFDNGNYDCLTGTAFFSVVLENLEFKYRIIETNYHIFLLVDTSQGEILIETTDRYFGFKTKAEEINNSLNQYKKNLLAGSTEKKYYHYHTNLFREVNGMQLSGLLYFNQAVVAYNHHNWIECTEKLENARSIYNNTRVEELTEILIGSITISDLKESSKQELLSKLKKHLKSTPILAVR